MHAAAEEGSASDTTEAGNNVLADLVNDKLHVCATLGCADRVHKADLQLAAATKSKSLSVYRNLRSF